VTIDNTEDAIGCERMMGHSLTLHSFTGVSSSTTVSHSDKQVYNHTLEERRRVILDSLQKVSSQALSYPLVRSFNLFFRV
jgi:hypothetical protein